MTEQHIRAIVNEEMADRVMAKAREINPDKPDIEQALKELNYKIKQL